MSVVTNIILSIGISEKPERIKEVNKYFDNGICFVSVDDEKLPRGWYGGSKMLECEIFIGAFNHLYFEGFMEHLKSVKWEYPEILQVIIKGDDDDIFHIETLST
jgi:hypothetical protein